MIEFLINLTTKENQIVLDSFVGSGTTAVASKNLNRNFIGFEIHEKYCEIGNLRLNNRKNNELEVKYKPQFTLFVK